MEEQLGKKERGSYDFLKRKSLDYTFSQPSDRTHSEAFILLLQNGSFFPRNCSLRNSILGGNSLKNELPFRLATTQEMRGYTQFRNLTAVMNQDFLSLSNGCCCEFLFLTCRIGVVWRDSVRQWNWMMV